ncbi:MAG: S-layer homology domain-containing protein [Clostridia bacterium]
MKRIISVSVMAAVISSLFLGSVCAEPGLVAKFKDVKDSDWYAEAVVKMSTSKIIDGMPGGSFNPQGEVTRAQFVKMLVQAMEYKKIDSISFEDIKPLPTRKAHWASVYIETALRSGVIMKDEIGSNFYPDIPLTRKDMGMMMFRALKLQPSTGDNPFADITETNGYLTKLYEEYLIRGNVISGKVLFDPEALSTRAQAAVIISRMLEYKENPAAYVEKTGMEERFKNGTQTAVDIEKKREQEIEKAKADPNYIMEPQIRILNTLEDFKGYGDRAERYFKLTAGYIALDNLEDYQKYTPDIQMKIVAIEKDKDLLNTNTRLAEPFISYDHVYEVRHDRFGVITGLGYDEKLKACDIYSISRDEEKVVNDKWTKVPDYVKKGEIVSLKLYFKRGNNIQSYDIGFEVK